MRKQMGWYNAETELFCSIKNKSQLQSFYSSFTVPVYINDESTDEVPLQILRNQHFIMQQLWDWMPKAGKFEQIHRDSTMYDVLQEKTCKLLTRKGYKY